MNLGHLCQIISKSDKEINGYGQLAQHAIFAYHMVRQTPLVALPCYRPNTARYLVGRFWVFRRFFHMNA